MATKFEKVDSKTQRMVIGGRTLELRKAGAKWTVWLDGEEHKGLAQESIKRAKMGALMWAAMANAVVRK